MGGILADDMGLGKTHQALALIETVLRETTASTPILVVCPASVLLHWADKINRFYPVITSYSIHYTKLYENSIKKNHYYLYEDVSRFEIRLIHM